MIIRSRHPLPIISADRDTVYPLLPLMTAVLFPRTTLTLQIGRPENLRLLRSALRSNSSFICAYSHADIEIPTGQPLHQVGTLAIVRDLQEGPGRSVSATIEGRERVAIQSVATGEPVLQAAVARLEPAASVSIGLQDAIATTFRLIAEITQLDPIYSPELSRVLEHNREDPDLLADRVAASFHFSLSAKQELLETLPLESRYEQLISCLEQERSRIATVLSINENARKQIEEDQRRHVLRQQLVEIKRQLGEDFREEKEAARWTKILTERTELPPEVVNRARIEIDRLKELSPGSSEFGVIKSYLDLLLNLPWGKTSNQRLDIGVAEGILVQDYFGPRTVREQVLQRLSVRQLLGGTDRGPTLCLVGAPGTGKASLARAVARAMGREFVRISVGGVNDPTALRGVSRTFLGAQSGRFLRRLRQCRTVDPVILVEDIDVFNLDNDAAVNMALLSIIDARRNHRFIDEYLGVPFDFSQALFICSVQSYEDLPEPFIPRFDILEMPSFIEREKIQIAKKYILPQICERHGLRRKEVRLSDRTLSLIITGYTREAGLLAFSQQIEKICRKIALEKAEGRKRVWTLTERNLDGYLGTPLYMPEVAETAPEIGTAAGLAWTGAGGELMFIEGLKMRGDAQIITTGSLGDVMRESIQAAHSYVRSKADVLGIDPNDFREFDLHIHFPSGAIPKDGPSAGVAVCMVIASVLAERPIRNDIAMTGEMTLRGRILPVAGIKEKVAAAFRAGITEIVLPKGNEKDLKELPAEVIGETTFHLVERVDELFAICLLDFQPSSFTLEKLFHEEIDKARTRNRRGRKTGRPSPAAKSPRRRRSSRR